MTLEDFIAKKRHELETRGVLYATKSGVQEVALKSIGRYANKAGTPIWDADADVVLVLDACRVDLWEDTARERYPRAAHGNRWSVGSASVEWVGNTFAPKYRRHWRDAGYVTANAFSGKQPGVHRTKDVYPLRDLDMAYLDEVWVGEWDTGTVESVMPATVTDRAMWAYERRDELGFDTLVVHYMQPHVPFRSKPGWSDGWKDQYAFGTECDTKKRSEWDKLRDGDIEREELWAAYKDNLEFVLQEVDRWNEATSAKLLITSDHGNAMGEWGMWGHPVNVPVQNVRRVPWAQTLGKGERKPKYDLQITPPVHASKQNDIDERLEALGYV